MAELYGTLRPGQIVVIGTRLYGRCADCGAIVRLNKWVLGSLHVCAEDRDA